MIIYHLGYKRSIFSSLPFGKLTLPLCAKYVVLYGRLKAYNCDAFVGIYTVLDRKISSFLSRWIKLAFII